MKNIKKRILCLCSIALLMVPLIIHAAPQWGIFTNPQTDSTALEQSLGQKFDNFLWYNASTETFDTNLANTLKSQGKHLQLAWEPRDPAGDPVIQPAYKLSTFLPPAPGVPGAHDADIIRWANSLKDYGETVYFRPMSEMNGNWTTWSGTVNGNSPSDYIPAWRHIHDIFVSEGATNVRFVWAVNNESVNAAGNHNTPENDMALYYPGDAYVDYLGVNGYNFGPSQYSSWTSFYDLFMPFYQKTTQITSTLKPIIIGEMGSNETGGNKAAWINQMFADLSISFPRVEQIYWFNMNKERDWRINSSQSAFDAFKANFVTNFTMQYYRDSGLTQPVSGGSTLGVGSYYVKITSDRTLLSNPTVSIDAEGTANDVTSGVTSHLTGNDYLYTRNIVAEPLAVGTTLENISVSGTSATNNSTNVNPIDEAQKEIYTKGTIPHFISAKFISDNELQVTYSENISGVDGTKFQSQSFTYSSTETIAGSVATFYINPTYNDTVSATDMAIFPGAVWNAANNYSTETLSNKIVASKPPTMISAVEVDTNGVSGIQAGDKVVVTFSRPVMTTSFPASLLYKRLPLYSIVGGNTVTRNWLDGNNTGGSVTWLNSRTLQVTLTTNISAPDFSGQMYIEINPANTNNIKDLSNNYLSGRVYLSGDFNSHPAPTFSTQYYMDSALTIPYSTNPQFSTWDIGYPSYLKVTSSQTLNTNPTISIDAEGTANDVTNGSTFYVSGNSYVFIRQLSAESASTGTLLENISVTATSTSGASTNVAPSNIVTSAAYIDTLTPHFISAKFTSRTNLQLTYSEELGGYTPYSEYFTSAGFTVNQSGSWSIESGGILNVPIMSLPNSIATVNDLAIAPGAVIDLSGNDSTESLSGQSVVDDRLIVLSATCADTTNYVGIQSGDKVTISFSKPTNQPTIDATNINAYLPIVRWVDGFAGSESWLDGSGHITSAVWTDSSTLVVTLSTNNLVPDIRPGDSLDFGYATSHIYTATSGQQVAGALNLDGTFDGYYGSLTHIVVSPSTTQTIMAGQTVQFTAQGQDSNNHNLPGLTYSWTGANSSGLFSSSTIGTYPVSATSSGINSTSVSVVVTPATLDHINILPASTQTIGTGHNIQFSAQGQDQYNNNISNLTYTWTNATTNGLFNNGTIGSYGVKASNGGVNSSVVTVIVTSDVTPPTFVNLPDSSTPINVTDNQVITTNPYIIKVKPSDDNGISKVEFYIDDILIGTVTQPDSDGVYSFPWDTSKYHSIVKVIAYDTSSNPSTVLTKNTQVRLASSSTVLQTILNLPNTLPAAGPATTPLILTVISIFSVGGTLAYYNKRRNR